jgi:hypothetical protein
MRLETLSSALFIALEGKATEKECNEIALNVLDLFGYGERALSNQFSNDDYATMYFFEDMGLIRSETSLHLISDRKKRYVEWKTIEFILCTDRINTLATSSLHVRDEFEVYIEDMKAIRKMYEKFPEKFYPMGAYS